MTTKADRRFDKFFGTAPKGSKYAIKRRGPWYTLIINEHLCQIDNEFVGMQPRQEVKDWMQENVGDFDKDDWDFREVILDYYNGHYYPEVRMYFPSLGHLVQFQLVWGDGLVK